MLRRAVLLLGFVLLAGGPSTATPQPARKVYRVGYIQTATPDEQRHLTQAFEDALRDLGYVEGRNVIFERRFAWGKPEHLPELAAELVGLDVDVIVTGGNPVIAAVKTATATIPVVMTTGRDPVGAGFIADHARPGGNITGLATDPSIEVLAKGLEILMEIVPKAARVALLWNPVAPGAATSRRVAVAAARQLGVELRVVEIRSRDELEGAFARMADEKVDGVWVLPDPLTFTARQRVVALATKYRLPSVYWQREYVDAGGLVSYGSNVAQLFRRAAWYVDRILKGARPGELPVEQASQFELVINFRTASLLGLTIPQSVVLRADDAIR